MSKVQAPTSMDACTFIRRKTPAVITMYLWIILYATMLVKNKDFNSKDVGKHTIDFFKRIFYTDKRLIMTSMSIDHLTSNNIVGSSSVLTERRNGVKFPASGSL